MKLLLDFMQTNRVEYSKIAKLLNLSRKEALVIKYIVKNYVNDMTPLISVVEILVEVLKTNSVITKKFGDLNIILDLYKKGIIFISQYNPMLPDIPKFEPMISFKGHIPLMNLYNGSISLQPSFLSLLERGEETYFLVEIPETAYENSLEHIKDELKRVALFIEHLEDNFILDVEKHLEMIENKIQKRIELTQFPLPLHKLFIEKKLQREEQLIFLSILGEEYKINNSHISYKYEEPLIQLISLTAQDKLKNRIFLDENSTLRKEKLINYDLTVISKKHNRNDRREAFYINREILKKIENRLENKIEIKAKKESLQKIVEKQSIFELIKPKEGLDEVILPNKTQDLLQKIVKQLDRKVINRLIKWGIKEKGAGINARIILHGPSGTGKTLTALSFAKSLKRDILDFDCSKILSMYVGESEKNVRNIFDTYKQIVKDSGKEPILLLNEADQFLTSRSSNLSSSITQMYNQMQNIFLEQIENFSGILIATTNLLENIDKAFSRRFNYKVQFELPTKEERIKIWKKHLPQNVEFTKDFSIEKIADYKLSGGQIDIIVKNCAYNVATRDNLIFSNEDFITEIEREQKSTFDKNRIMGFLS